MTSQTQVNLPGGKTLELTTTKVNPTKKEIKQQLETSAPAFSNVSERDMTIRRKFTG